MQTDQAEHVVSAEGWQGTLEYDPEGHTEQSEHTPVLLYCPTGHDEEQTPALKIRWLKQVEQSELEGPAHELHEPWHGEQISAVRLA